MSVAWGQEPRCAFHLHIDGDLSPTTKARKGLHPYFGSVEQRIIGAASVSGVE